MQYQPKRKWFRIVCRIVDFICYKRIKDLPAIEQEWMDNSTSSDPYLDFKNIKKEAWGREIKKVKEDPMYAPPIVVDPIVQEDDFTKEDVDRWEEAMQSLEEF